MNVLIVEDNENMRRMIHSLVVDLADETHECADGAEALAAYARHLPDWVLMDIKTKGLDGITATRQIKEVFPQANIMIVSDYDDQDLRLAASAAGASEYVVKESLPDVRRILRASSDVAAAGWREEKIR